MLFLKPKKGNKEFIKKNSAQNPKILEVNLIKGEVRISFDWQKHLALVIFVFVIAGAFIVEIYFGLDLWAKQERTKADVLTVEIIKVSQEIKDIQTKADAALLYKEKSSEVSRLLDNHVYWSGFFDWLEKNTLSSVEFAEFSGDLDGVYELEATASSYQDVSWQVKALSDSPFVKKVEVLKAEAAESKGETINEVTFAGKRIINFSLQLEVNQDLFKK